MSSYYVRIKPQLSGTNAVHKEGCPFLPDIEDRIYLGKYGSALEALKEALRFFSTSSCCHFCANEGLKNKRKIYHDWPDKQIGLRILGKSACN